MPFFYYYTLIVCLHFIFRIGVGYFCVHTVLPLCSVRETSISLAEGRMKKIGQNDNPELASN